MTRDELEAIRTKVEADNPMAVMVDRRELVAAHDAHVAAFRAIIKALVHGRSVAKDMQDAVKIACDAIQEPLNPFYRDCGTDPDEDLGAGVAAENPDGS